MSSRRQLRIHERWNRLDDVALSAQCVVARVQVVCGECWFLELSRYVHFTPERKRSKVLISTYRCLVTAVPCSLILPITAAISHGFGNERNVNPHDVVCALPVPDRYTIGLWNLIRCPFLLVDMDSTGPTNTNTSE